VHRTPFRPHGTELKGFGSRGTLAVAPDGGQDPSRRLWCDAAVPPALRPFRPADVRRQVLLQHVAVSPDGTWAAYSRRTVEKGEYRGRLWRVPLDRGRPEQLTFADSNDAGPQFSPDGRELAFLSDRSGRFQPWTLPLGGGEPRKVAELEGQVAAAKWSPDGQALLLLAPSGEDRFLVGDGEKPVARRILDLTWRLDGVGLRDQFTSLWTVPTRGGSPRRLTQPHYEVADAAWLGNARIAFLADLGEEAGVIEFPQAYSVTAGGGRTRPLASLGGYILSLACSPNGRVALVGVDRADPVGWENENLYVVEGRRVRQLGGGLDRPIGNRTFTDILELVELLQPRPQWVDDESLVALVADRGGSRPFRFPLDGPPEPLLDDHETVCAGLAVGGGRIVVVAAEPGRAGELCEVDEGKLRPLTHHGSRWLAPHRIEPERISVRQRGGPAIDAWLVPARGRRRKAPLVLKIHGGPHGAYGPVPFTETLALAHAGFHVLYANPQGSSGYGEEFARALTGKWGELDSPEQLAAVNWAVRQGLADRDRVGVLGLSYGGYMVNWLLGHHPGRFGAGVSENPVTELVSHFGTCDFATWVGPTAVGARFPHEDPDGYRERSPATLIHRNKAPLLLLQCEGDLRCPADQSEIVFGILRGLGREVEYVRYPEEFHIMVSTGRPDRRVDRLERIVDWFERHLR
jgi:dipeptidyl aminopeptidase/acylaminoacyl peptidase